MERVTPHGLSSRGRPACWKRGRHAPRGCHKIDEAVGICGVNFRDDVYSIMYNSYFNAGMSWDHLGPSYFLFVQCSFADVILL